MKHFLWGALALSLSGVSFGQIVPEDSQVDLYFPHLADGKGGQTWQTRFTFVNPSTTTAAEVGLYTYADDGSAWALDLGTGAKAMQDFFVPPQGRVTLASAIGPQFKTGWAAAFSTLPLQATAAFREFAGSTPVLDLTAPATLPSQLYRSAANKNLGIALANVYQNAPMAVTVTAFDQSGKGLQSAQVSLPANGHASFNLNQLMPSLPANFLGSIEMAPVNAAWQFLGWTANEDSGALSTLPPGRAEWPISHVDRVWLVYLRVLDEARQIFPQVNFDGPQGIEQAAVNLQTPATYVYNGQQIFNASSHPTTGALTIPLSTSELISDSESEIAFIVAHELGHQIQYRLGAGSTPKFLYNSNIESDADVYGLMLSLGAGFDPYAAAGALAKISMGNGQAGLAAQVFADANVALGYDFHLSYGDRINGLWGLLNNVCASNASLCANYKSLIHPDFPPQTPLDRPAQKLPISSAQPLDRTRE